MSSRDFSNDLFSINIEETAGCVVSAKVQANPLVTQKCHKEALKTVKKNVVLPGFRKGKAPDNIIEARYATQVEQELRRFLLRASFEALSQMCDRKPLSPKAVRSSTVDSCNAADGGVVSFLYEAFPVIPSLPWEQLNLSDPEPVKEISDEDLENGLKNVAYFFATKTPVTRPSQEGDFISLSLHVSKKGDLNSNPVAIFENKYFKISEEDMTDAFKARFLNVSTGHRVEEEIASEDIQSFLNGDLLTFTVNAVIEISSPEMDDEKARQLQAESLEDLKKKLRIQLENQAKEEHHQKRFSAAEDALAQLIDFDLPQSLLQEREEILSREKLLNARLVKYCSDSELEEQKQTLLEEAKADARKAVKLLFLTQKVFSEKELSISREELQRMMDVCSRERFGAHPPKDISNEMLQELVLAARDRLTYHKAIEAISAEKKDLEVVPS
ncbi:trigger factor [Chlamydia muridarum str. Nigg]|uniref:Trigger factor n=1 Tax=Chlamydia muridarum TaxID=83560 RepID=A0A069ZQL9_CHLMR|nr:trigger factor [Chlamydia muridarum]UFT96769.1 trigger factor [Chlamydia trachomatis]AID37630.1 trigger factor [Chlamydia muridarum str. Nigg 2 MCR]AIT91068.1 trigger factor [Chlamydia muridarum]AIT91959.1 trigger factor [Chlamydia muridarum]AIW23837.1 trigger factor [Chlamydia muridarum]